MLGFLPSFHLVGAEWGWLVEAEDFWLAYVDARGESRGGPLEVMWPACFEAAGQVRAFPSYRGQRNFPGWYWTATNVQLVGYESWAELAHLMRLDADPDVVAVASQPFQLSWRHGGRDRRVRHTPDYFVRHRDGTAIVLDVRPDERIEPADAAKFAATAAACARVGWHYERVGVLDLVFAANLRWLSGYRHPRVRREETAEDLREVFTQPRGLLAGAQAVGDPIAVLPVLFHLLWCREMTVDLERELLSAATLVHPAPTVVKEVGGDAGTSAAAVAG
ncbi:TnsA-like heteromeric transposase endonuclease subunit [Streptomyces qinglanensis]|uniref:TnsA-like heteromeric transposase endonuclease subunit n=1 Tax=Streptomyces qinglanensis TaxID=943816 RepID=UPI003D74FE25